VDGSAAAKRAIAYGALLADRLGARLSFAHVQPPVGSIVELKAAADEEAEAMLEAIALCYPQADSTASIVVGNDVACAICDTFPDAIVVVGSDHAARHPSGPQESVAEALVRAAHNHPILVLGARADAKSLDGPIAIALDGSKIAEEALLAALAWTRSFATPVHLLQVIPPSASRDPSEPTANDYLESVHAHLSAGGVDSECFLIVDDDPVTGIVGHLRDHRCSLVVMSTHARRGIEREAMGSVTMGVIAASPCAVCAVHPDTAAALELPAGAPSEHAQIARRQSA
jgi:nucleotide-binding universal stress UspA family protein